MSKVWLHRTEFSAGALIHFDLRHAESWGIAVSYLDPETREWVEKEFPVELPDGALFGSYGLFANLREKDG